MVARSKPAWASAWLGGSSIAMVMIVIASVPTVAFAQVQSPAPAPDALPLAQNAAVVNIEEIVVSARKRSERLRDIPTAGLAIGSDQIRELGGVSTAQSLLTNSAGVNFANTSNPVTSEISIRGSGTSRATAAESGVGLFRNGAFVGGGTVGGRTLTNLDFFDVERIEILRGVQGGLNGRNAEGGSVNAVSARPTHKFEGYAIGTVANNEHEEVQLVVNVPIDDRWAIRLGGDYLDQAKGFYHIYLLKTYADSMKRQFARGQINFNSGKFGANLLLEHGFERLQGLTYSVTGFPTPTYPKGFQQDRFELPYDYTPMGKQEVTNAEFTANYDFGFADLTSVSLYRIRSGHNIYDRDASSTAYAQQLVNAGLVGPTFVNSVLTADNSLQGDQGDLARIYYQNFNLIGKKTGGFTWLFGGEYYLLRDRPSSILGRTPTTANPSPGTIDKSTNHFQSYAFYGSAGYDLTDQLNLTGDLRVTRYDQEYHSKRLDIRTQLPTSAAFTVDGFRGKTKPSYDVTLGYKPINDWLVYAKIGSAFRSGNFNASLGDPRQPITPPPSFDDETVTAYEVGFKGNLFRNIYVDGAAYKNDFDNLVIQGNNGCAIGNPVCPVQQTSFAFSAGPASLYGFEIEATARFKVFGGPLRLTFGGDTQGGKIKTGIYKGFRQPQQPSYSLTFDANYRHEIANKLDGFINIKGSGRFGGVQEALQTPLLNDYVLVDARAGIERGKIEAALYAENLFNITYIVFDAPTATNRTSRYNNPRNYGLQVRYTW